MEGKNEVSTISDQVGVAHNVADEGKSQPPPPEITFTAPLTEAMEVEPLKTAPEAPSTTSSIAHAMATEDEAAPAAPTLAESAGSSSGQASSSAVRVFNPSEAASAPVAPELDENFFESTLSDVQAHHASIASRSKRLNDAPLLTSKHRDVEKERQEKKKAEKWPSDAEIRTPKRERLSKQFEADLGKVGGAKGTTIRVKFSDGTQVQSSFPSSSPIQPVYAFVRTCLDPSASSKPFTLWQPPRYSYPEHPPPPVPSQTKKRPLSSAQIVVPANYGPVRGAPMAGLQGGKGGTETLGELGLVPQSVLMIRWEDDEMNVTGYPAPLLPELRQKAEPLPSASTHRAEQKEAEATTPSTSTGDGEVKERKIPKWLQKGLLKKK